MSTVLSLDDMNPESRRAYIGASDLPVICGVSPFKSPYRLALEKIGEVEPDDLDDNPYVEAGNELEPVVRAWYARKAKLTINARHITFEHPKHPFIRCHVDGHIVGHERGSGLFEAKTAGYWMGQSEEWGESDTDLFPMPYHVQCQGMLAITRWAWGRLAALIGGNDLRWYPVEPDTTLQAKIIGRAVAFWEAVQTKDLSDLDRSTDDAKALFPVSLDSPIEADADVLQTVAELKKRNAECKAMEEEVDALKARVQCFMGQHDTLVAGGKQIATWKTQSRKAYAVSETSFRKFLITKGS